MLTLLITLVPPILILLYFVLTDKFREPKGTVINKTIDNRVRRWEEKFKTEEDFKGGGMHSNNIGTIIKKLKLTFNVATSQFDHED